MTAPLAWQSIQLSDIGIEDTVRESGRRWILRDVNLELEHGEWLALTGPTGAGKTTLADVMLMLIRADAGTLRIEQQVCWCSTLEGLGAERRGRDEPR